MEGFDIGQRRLATGLDAKPDAVESVAGIKARNAADPQFASG
jgi:hypothetical protein